MFMKKRILEYVCTHWVYDIDDVEKVIGWIGFQDHLDCLEENRLELVNEVNELKNKVAELSKKVEPVKEVAPQPEAAPKKKKRHYNKKKNINN